MNFALILKGGVGSGHHKMGGGYYCSFHKDTKKIAFIGSKKGALTHRKANPDHSLGYTGPGRQVGDTFGAPLKGS
jgi:hypothetical protein